MKINIPKLEAVENSSLVSTFRTSTKTQRNQVLPNGHLTDGRKSVPSLKDYRRIQAGRVERDGFCIQS